MATIHQTSLVPGKLDLLAAWLPRQPWFVGPDSPELRKAGGFRLDDPAGEVGIEFMIVNAVCDRSVVTYNVPMTYRAGPLPNADRHLIGIAMHGVLGSRWIYDGTADPVFLEELTRLMSGTTRAQHQSRSDQVDSLVVVRTIAPTDTSAARIIRVLSPRSDEACAVEATWTAPDGSPMTGAVVRT